MHQRAEVSARLDLSATKPSSTVSSPTSRGWHLVAAKVLFTCNAGSAIGRGSQQQQWFAVARRSAAALLLSSLLALKSGT